MMAPANCCESRMLSPILVVIEEFVWGGGNLLAGRTGPREHQARM